MSTSLDEDIVVLEDLDLELECEVRIVCGVPPSWALINPCCGMTSLLCNQHKEAIAVWMKTQVALGGILRCEGCQTRPLDPDDFSWEKL